MNTDAFSPVQALGSGKYDLEFGFSIHFSTDSNVSTDKALG